MKKSVMSALGLLMIVCMLMASTVVVPAEEAGDEYEIVMIAKVEGLAWFDATRAGVELFSSEHDDVNAYQVSPEDADATKQAAMIEDYIAKGVDAICVIPVDSEALLPVVKKAKAAGITVVCHEGSPLAGTADYDFEAIDNYEFGAQLGENLAQAMGGEGKYCAVVGGLTMITHMQWFQGAYDWITANYPDMELMNENAQPYEDNDDPQIGYDVAKEALKAHPDITGYLALTVESGTAMSQYLKENNNKNIKVGCLATPNALREYVKEGWCTVAMGNSPVDAGYATVEVAYKLLKGEEITDGMDLGKEGMESVGVKDGIIQANGILNFTPDNIDNYDF